MASHRDDRPVASRIVGYRVAAAALVMSLLSFSVQGQAFAVSGSAIAPVGGVFQVNTYTTVYQYFPSVAERLVGQLRRGMAEQERGRRHSWLGPCTAQRYLPEPSFVPSLGAMLAIAGRARRGGGSRHEQRCYHCPPSMRKTSPVTHAASSEAR